MSLSLGVLGCRNVAVTADAVSVSEPELVEPEARFPDLFVHYNYGCALAHDGRIWCWGSDPGVRLGLRAAGERWQRATALAGIGPAVAIDGDEWKTCAVLEDGQAWCWQIPLYESPHGSPDGYPPEVVPGVSDVVDVAVDGDVCVRTKIGEIHCSTLRGENRRQVASNAVDFAISEKRACALDAEGGVWCWDSFAERILATEEWAGERERGPSGELLMARLPGAVEIDVGDTNRDVLVRMDSGEILIEPTVGPELALPVTSYKPIAGADHAVALEFGRGHGCIVAEPSLGEREVRCFMGNGWAQLGAGDSQPHAEAVTVAGLGEVVGVAASRSLSCASTRTGVACWGTRLQGPTEPLSEGPRVLATEVASVVVNFGNTCASTSDGNNVCWGSTGLLGYETDGLGIFGAVSPQPLGLELGRLRGTDGYGYYDDAGVLLFSLPTAATFGGARELVFRREGVSDYVFGDAAWCFIVDGALRCEDLREQPRAVPMLHNPTAITSAEDTFCVIYDGGKLGCFELPELRRGQDPASAPTPKLIEIPGSVDTVAVHGSKTLRKRCYGALERDGVVSLFCLPRTQLGAELDELGSFSLPPVDEFVHTQIGVCGRVRASGQIACEPYDRSEVSTFDLGDVVALAGDGNHWCALTRDGTLTCMGDNRWGQLGVLPPTVVATPLAIEFD
jgi:hypothetical protein